MLELFCFGKFGQVHLSSLLPSSLSSADVSPIHDLCIHWSHSSQAMHFVVQAFEYTPHGNFGALGPGFGSIPAIRRCFLCRIISTSRCIIEIHHDSYKNDRPSCRNVGGV